MMNFKNGLWLMTSFTVVTSLAGCRFGNYTAPGAPTSTIWQLGNTPSYFVTEVIYTDKNPDGTHLYDSNANTPMIGLPSSVSSTFSDPVGLIFPADKSEPFFYNPATQLTMGTTVTAQNAIDYAGASSQVTLWKNPACLTQLQIDQTGTINFNQHDSYTDSSGTTQSTKGRLTMDLTVIRVIQGDCLADLHELAACYQDSSSCDTATYNSAFALFDTWVHFGGFLKLDDATLTRILGLAYMVHFE